MENLCFSTINITVISYLEAKKCFIYLFIFALALFMSKFHSFEDHVSKNLEQWSYSQVDGGMSGLQAMC